MTRAAGLALFLAALTLSVTACTTVPREAPAQQAGVVAAPPAEAVTGDSLKVWATHYRVHPAKAVADGYPLLSTTGQEFTRLGAYDWCQGAVQGTIAVEQDGQIRRYNYVKGAGEAVIDCSPFFKTGKVPSYVPALGRGRYIETDAPYGLGVSNYHLVPYRTIAVDKTYISYGSIVFIPAAVGIPYEVDGAAYVHDGYFFAGDMGGAIKGDHIDVFVGLGSAKAFAFIDKKQGATPVPVEARLVNDPAIKARLLALHRP